jgi:hypothetical protein
VSVTGGDAVRTITGRIPVATIVLVAVAGVGLSGRAAQAGDACLTAPNGPAPAGSHWYYRTDQATQRKCWSIKPRSQAQQTLPAQATAVQEKPAISLAATASVGAAANTVLPPAQWADPAPAAGAASVVWPDPPTLPPSTDNIGTSQAAPSSPDTSAPKTSAPAPAPQSATGNAPPVNSAQPTHASSPTGTQPEKDTLAVKAVGEPSKVTAPGRKTAAAAALAGVIGLLLAGAFLRRLIAKSLGRRRAVKVARQEPSLIEPRAGKQPVPTHLRHSPSLVPSHAEAARRINEVEAALRKLAQRQRALAPPRTVARRGAGVRS